MREDERGPGAGAGAGPVLGNGDDDAAAAAVHSAVLPDGLRSSVTSSRSLMRRCPRSDPQALLDVLVDRVKEALQADTAAVLLLDRPSGQLVATAASGLEEEVQQEVRIPLGKGFAGRIAAQGRPVILDEVDRTKVVNPILLAKGIRSLMGAPLLAEGTVIGVLHVGTLSPRAFTSHDVDLLQLAADRGRAGSPGTHRSAGPRGCVSAAAQPDADSAARRRRAGDGRPLRSRHREGGGRLV